MVTRKDYPGGETTKDRKMVCASTLAVVCFPEGITKKDRVKMIYESNNIGLAEKGRSARDTQNRYEGILKYSE